MGDTSLGEAHIGRGAAVFFSEKIARLLLCVDGESDQPTDLAHLAQFIDSELFLSSVI